jgi:hypothetical protein
MFSFQYGAAMYPFSVFRVDSLQASARRGMSGAMPVDGRQVISGTEGVLSAHACARPVSRTRNIKAIGHGWLSGREGKLLIPWSVISFFYWMLA